MGRTPNVNHVHRFGSPNTHSEIRNRQLGLQGAPFEGVRGGISKFRLASVPGCGRNTFHDIAYLPVPTGFIIEARQDLTSLRFVFVCFWPVASSKSGLRPNKWRHVLFPRNSTGGVRSIFRTPHQQVSGRVLLPWKNDGPCEAFLEGVRQFSQQRWQKDTPPSSRRLIAQELEGQLKEDGGSVSPFEAMVSSRGHFHVHS